MSRGRKCLQCGAAMKGSVENYRYDEGGLDSVILTGITIYRCPSCGESEPVIPNTMGLHEALTRATATKKERLTPKEIRFLRTHLGYSSADFARKMGVSVQTVSRWERDHEPLGMKSSAEKLLRIMALVGDAVESYHLEEMATEEPVVSVIRPTRTKSGSWAA